MHRCWALLMCWTNVWVSGNRLACVRRSSHGNVFWFLVLHVYRSSWSSRGLRKVDGCRRLTKQKPEWRKVAGGGCRCAEMLMSQTVLMWVINASEISAVIWVHINRYISRPLWGQNGKNELLHLHCSSRPSSLRALIGPVVPTTAGKQTVAFGLWPQGWLPELLWIPQL